jgi:hypothetical protein
MGTKVTFTNITAGFMSADQLNANFDTISDAFDDYLSRDGTTPNTMTADLDMNSNDILNAGTINSVDLVVNGTSLDAQITAAATSATDSATDAAASAASAAASAASAATAATLTEFTSLTDAPASYSGQSLLGVRVNAGETALEFASASATVGDADYGDITVTGSGTVWSIDAGAVDTAELAADAVTTIKITDGNVTLAKIAGAALSGSDATLVTGTAGTLNYTAKWNTDGDLVDGFEVLDEDAMGSDSDTKLATQQSIKAYVDTQVTAGGITYGTATATTSGTTHDYTSLPAGINRITVMLAGVSLSGTDKLLIELGDSGGFETSGYSSTVGAGDDSSSASNGFVLNHSTSAGYLYSGIVVLTRQTSNTWVQSGNMFATTAQEPSVSAGLKTLTAELTQVRLLTTGSNTFDAGSVNIMYE